MTAYTSNLLNSANPVAARRGLGVPPPAPLVKHVMLFTAYTPLATGADMAEVTVPYAADGRTEIRWIVRRIELRVVTAGGTPAVQIEKSTGSGAFSAVILGSVALADGTYENQTIGDLGTVLTGDKLRANILNLGVGALNWTVIVELSNS